MPTYSHVLLDNRRLTESELQRLLLEEEHAADETPACVYSIATLEAVTPAAVVERVRRAELFDPDFVGEPAEA